MEVLAINKFYFIFGGSDRYYFELNASLQNAGIDVIPFAMAHENNFPSPYSPYFVSEVDFWNNSSLIEKFRASGRVLYSSEARRKLSALLKVTQPDLAHIHLIYHQISPSILPVLKEQGIPIVQTLHDYKPICPTYNLMANGEICERCKGGHFIQATLQRCNRRSLLASSLNTIEMYLHHFMGYYRDYVDRYITPSDFMRKKLIEFGMQPDNILHIPNFVDPDRYPLRTNQGSYYAYIGRLVQEKGLMTLLKAAEQLRETELLIIGEGPQRRELERAKVEWGLDHVKFLGYQSGEALQELFSQAMFTVLPSEWYENCPMSILESLAQGVPVIGSRVGGIPELIEHEKDGLLFTMGDVDDLVSNLKTLIRDPARCREMGRSGREKVSARYDQLTHRRRILEVYEQTLK